MLETSHPGITNEGGSYTPIGLPNLSATCHLNALLQCFNHVMPIRDLIFGLQPNDETKRKLLTALKETLNYISSGKASEEASEEARCKISDIAGIINYCILS